MEKTHLADEPRETDGGDGPQRRSSPGDGNGGHPSAVAGCRVVTTFESARLLLAGQLRAFPAITWTIVSGDECQTPPEGVSATYRIPMRRDLSTSDLASFFRLLRFFRSHKFTFVQTHTQKASLLGLPAARCAGLPTLYTMHGCLFFRENSVLQNVLGWVFERWCCTWAQRVLVQSREDEEMVPRAKLCRADKVAYIGNGIALGRFRPTPLPSRTGERPVVMMISRLVAEKGCREFFAVAKALHGKARFVHVGPVEAGQRDAISRTELDEMAAHGYVEFLGATDDVPAHLANADLVVLPSFREGIPRVAMEAAAMGRAVAGYDVRGMREVIPRHLGLLVPRGDTGSLIQLVEGLLDAPERLVELGTACGERVVSRFSEEAVLERLRHVYADFGVREQ